MLQRNILIKKIGAKYIISNKIYKCTLKHPFLYHIFIKKCKSQAAPQVPVPE